MGGRVLGAGLTLLLATTGALAAPTAPTMTVASRAVEFEVFLPLRDTAGLEALIAAQHTPGSPNYHQWLTPAAFGTRFGADAATIARVTDHLRATGFTVTGSGASWVRVSATAGQVSRLFGATLLDAGNGRLVAASPISLTATLRAAGANISAFRDRPQLHVHGQRTGELLPANRTSATGAYSPADQKQAYDYPADTTFVNGKRLDGTGVHVAVLMAGGVLDTDIALSFAHDKFTAVSGRPVPAITRLSVNGGRAFSASDSGSVEASLDVQQLLGGAPGTALTLVSIPDLSDTNILAAYTQIVQSNAYDIVSSSFGGCELAYFPAYNGGVDDRQMLATYDALFKQGAAQGITFIASSGDSGGLACPSLGYFTGQRTPAATFTASVEFPASSPNVTSVGGTNLTTTYKAGSYNSAYVSENANGDPEVAYDPYGTGQKVSGGYWGAGGGVSAYFTKPDFQSLVTTGQSMRTVPDVGMHVGGCPGGIAVRPCGTPRSSGYVAVGGRFEGIIGTSLAAPEFASAVALFVEANGRQGNLNPYLYTMGAQQSAGGTVAYHRAQPGFDGYWSNTQPGGGYNYLVGNGTPDVRALFGFSAAQPAGIPATITNP